ncbi:MAG TPA: hypothetical protein VM553_00475 [Dongiaceae bacterium]|nr:hypothetical protein [Dongiaceae bacterium]
MSIQNLAPQLVVGESTGTILLESADDFRCAINRMAEQAVRSVRIFTQELDHDLYDHPDFLEIASSVCRQRRNCTLQILLKNADKASRLGHRLVELQKRLPSSIEIRSLPEEYEETNDEFFLVDDIALVKRFAIGYMRGHCEFRSIPDAVKKARWFGEVWERSEPCQELRRLSL